MKVFVRAMKWTEEKDTAWQNSRMRSESDRTKVKKVGRMKWKNNTPCSSTPATGIWVIILCKAILVIYNRSNHWKTSIEKSGSKKKNSNNRQPVCPALSCQSNKSNARRIAATESKRKKVTSTLKLAGQRMNKWTWKKRHYQQMATISCAAPPHTVPTPVYPTEVAQSRLFCQGGPTQRNQFITLRRQPDVRFSTV